MDISTRNTMLLLTLASILNIIDVNFRILWALYEAYSVNCYVHFIVYVCN